MIKGCTNSLGARRRVLAHNLGQWCQGRQVEKIVPGQIGEELPSSVLHFYVPTRWLSNCVVRGEGVATRDNDLESSSAVPVINSG